MRGRRLPLPQLLLLLHMSLLELLSLLLVTLFRRLPFGVRGVLFRQLLMFFFLLLLELLPLLLLLLLKLLLLLLIFLIQLRISGVRGSRPLHGRKLIGMSRGTTFIIRRPGAGLVLWRTRTRRVVSPRLICRPVRRRIVRCSGRPGRYRPLRP